MTADEYGPTFGDEQRRTLARVTLINTLTEDPRIERAWRTWYDACLTQLPEIARASAGQREYFSANPAVRSTCAKFFISAQPALLVLLDDAVCTLRIPGNPLWVTEMLFVSIVGHSLQKLIGTFAPITIGVPKPPPLELPISTTPDDAAALIKAAQGTLLTRDQEVDEIETAVRWFYQTAIQQPPTSKRHLAVQYVEHKRRRGEHLGSIPTALVRHRITKARRLLGLPLEVEI